MSPSWGPRGAGSMDKQATGSMGAVWREMHLASVEQRGDDVVASVTWDADAKAFEGRGSEGIKALVVSFVKGAATMKEREWGDLGTIGRIRFLELDVEGGMAEVVFASTARVRGPMAVVVGKGDL